MAAGGKLDIAYNRFRPSEHQRHNLRRRERDEICAARSLGEVLLINSVWFLSVKRGTGAVLCSCTARRVIVCENLSFGPREESITPAHAGKTEAEAEGRRITRTKPYIRVLRKPNIAQLFRRNK